MMKTLLHIPSIITLAALSLSTLQTANANDFTTAITNGKTNIDVRTRYEFADANDAADKDNAHALTTRIKLGYTTGTLYGFDANVEFEGNWALVDDYFVPAGATPQQPNTDVIPDAEGEEFNETWIRWSNDNFQAKYGRQRIILDQARFVGNVGWRQNEQTYDGLTLQYQQEKLFVFGAYLNNVNDIFFRNFIMDSALLNARYAFSPAIKLTGYAYLLDYETGTDSATIGVQATGNLKVSDSLTLNYLAEYANYSDYADADNIDADYLHANTSSSFSGINIKLGYELLGGADGGNSAFQTPLATLHAYNGWTDQFLTTPTVGLQDVSIAIGTKINGVKLLGVFHKFEADEGDIDFGNEVDLLAATKINTQFSVLGKVGFYNQGDASSGKVDTTRIWLQGQYQF